MNDKKWIPEFPTGEYTLINVMEEAVKTKVMELTASQDMCKCQKCLVDICAMVLNRMPGIYTTSNQGRLYSKVPQMAIDFETELIVQVARAIETVRSSPRHD